MIHICDICLKSPCHPRCPNAKDPKEIPVFVCSGCSREIKDGEDYWYILGEQFCEDCIDDARRIAEAVDETY